MTRLLLTGRATNRNGQHIVRSALVAQLQSEGHTVYTSIPERERIDYLVTSNASRNNRTRKVRWAERSGVETISYSRMWRLLAHGRVIMPPVAPTIDELERAAAVELIEREAMERQDREREEQLHQQRIYDCMEARDLTYGAAAQWIAAEQAAGDAARAAGAAMAGLANEPLAQTSRDIADEAAALRRLMPDREASPNIRGLPRSEPHTIPDPGTPHNNPRMPPDVDEALTNRVLMQKERARVRQEPARPEPATAPRRRIHVRR